MKINFLSWLPGAAFLLLTAIPLSAQKTGSAPEKMPEYPGGMPALVQYMTTNIKYPEAAKKAKAEGTVIVQFVVKADGTLSKISTKNEGAVPNQDLVREAVRVVKGMPKWTPAQAKGKAVSCEMALPVKFKL